MFRRSRVVGAVLAAGRSRRMGRSKALLPIGHAGETFVARIVRTLSAAGLDDLLVVGRSVDEMLRNAVTALEHPVRFVANPNADSGGQLSSLLVAVGEAEVQAGGGLLVVPVDMPLIRPATVIAVVDAFKSSDAPVVRVVHGGRHGHPVIFGSAMFDALRHADLALGARSIVRGLGAAVLDVEVDDPGVLQDIDSQGEYQRILGEIPP